MIIVFASMAFFINRSKDKMNQAAQTVSYQEQTNSKISLV